MKNKFTCAICLMLAALLFAGCTQAPGEKDLTAKDVAKISAAAGYLAARAEACQGFIFVESTAENRADDFAYLYDNAAAVIALSYAGAVWHAQQIADALVFAMENDRCFDDGRLRNAYIGGNPSSEAGRLFWGSKKSVRLPGFWKDDMWQEDYYSVSTSTGNMAWTILALCEAARTANEKKAAEYLTAAQRAADFVMTLRSSTGGFTGGYEGWDDSQTKVSYKSTEHNIDLISAFTSVAKLVEEEDSLKAAEYFEAAEHANVFVLTMYDKKKNCFYTGTADDGMTISKGVLPLDANSWALLVFGENFKNANLVFEFIENNIAVGSGFDFSAGDLDGIWNEGTAQMAVCYKMFGNTKAYDEIMAYLATQTAKDGSITAADRDGVSTGFFVSGTEVLWEYNASTNLGATNWLAFAQLGMNPLQAY